MSKKNFYSRLKLLIFNPKEGLKKVIPYIESKVARHERNFLEFLGDKRYSKPYNGTDELLKYVGKRGGFFVECGGNDGYFQDPTYYLEKFLGWSGIIVEPLTIAKLCEKNRKKSKVYNCALVPFGFKGNTVTLVDCNAMSVVKGGVENYEEWVKAGEKAQKIEADEIEVPARNLQDVLDDFFSISPTRQVDLLVLDVEGYEASVLRGVDLEKYKPTYVLVEIHTSERRKEIESMLGTSYKFLSTISHADYLYRYVK